MGRISPAQAAMMARVADAHKKTTLQEFIATWSMDAMPACEVGMAHLKRFADRHPEAYQNACAAGLWDLDQPGPAGIPEWEAFARHCSICDKCNEV